MLAGVGRASDNCGESHTWQKGEGAYEGQGWKGKGSIVKDAEEARGCQC